MDRRRRIREAWGRAFAAACAGMFVLSASSLILMVTGRGVRTFVGTGIGILEFLTGTRWIPDRSPELGGPALGIAPFILGSVTVCSLALMLAGPTGICLGVFLSELAAEKTRQIVRPTVNILSAIPSVVYGWMGLSTLVPLIREHLGGNGFSLLAGGLVLCVMILPTVTAASFQAIRSVPFDLREASYSLGATRWETISRILIPASWPGLATGLVLGLARALGEAMAVQMVIGNVTAMPSSILSPGVTLTAGITMEMGNTVLGSLWNNALWSMAMILLLISLAFTIFTRMVWRTFDARRLPSGNQ